MTTGNIISEKIWYYQLGIIVLGIILFIPFLGALPLFDWDEINFAECAREMIASGNYLQVQIDYAPFYEKPPGFIWLQVLMFKIFGVNEFAARLPNAITGIITLLLLFNIGNRFFNPSFGLLWVICYTASLLPHLYFRSGIIDPVFNLLIILGLYSGWTYISTKKVLSLLFTSLYIGLAILTKGPVALLILGGVLGIYLLFKKELTLNNMLMLFLAGIATLIIPSIWLALDWINNGPQFISEFLAYQIRLLTTEDAGHRGFWGYHFIIVFAGCFPVSFFAIKALFTKKNNNEQGSFILLNKILLLFILILFSIVQSKIVHYSSMAYFPVTLLGAVGLYKICNSRISLSRPIKVIFIIVNTILAGILILLPLINHFPVLLELLTEKDEFARALILLPSPWKPWDILPGLMMFITGSLWMTWTIFNKQKVFTMLFAYMVAVSLAIYTFPGRIAYYTQDHLITFLKEVSEKNELAYPLGHKSYAHLFYTNKNPEAFKISTEKPILSQHIPHDIYLFSRIDRPIDTDTIGNAVLQEIKREAGYIYYKLVKAN